MENVRVLGVGVAAMDIYVDRKRMYPGGNEYNVACSRYAFFPAVI